MRMHKMQKKFKASSTYLQSVLAHVKTTATIKHILESCKLVKNHRNYVAWKLNKMANMERDGACLPRLPRKKYDAKLATARRLIGPDSYLENQRGVDLKEKKYHCSQDLRDLSINQSL
mmetsp:Transcript_33144/g.64621  ORF Transcript_33144/g.64621 Transcript_33144/m.64621 type:complete len:118 (+) Transcript_33144:216-569(+)